MKIREERQICAVTVGAKEKAALKSEPLLRTLQFRRRLPSPRFIALIVWGRRHPSPDVRISYELLYATGCLSTPALCGAHVLTVGVAFAYVAPYLRTRYSCSPYPAGPNQKSIRWFLSLQCFETIIILLHGMLRRSRDKLLSIIAGCF